MTEGSRPHQNIPEKQGHHEAEALGPPLFITGCMRSGTTYLTDKLSGHPQLFRIASDLNEEWTKLGGAPCSGVCSYRGAEHTNDLFAGNMSDLFAQLVKENYSLMDRAKRMFSLKENNLFRKGRSKNITIPMNRSPHLINKLAYVNALFPEAKIILVVRDVLAHCASLKNYMESDLRRYGRRRFIPDDPKACWSSWNSGGGEPDQPCYPHDLSTLPKMWFRLNQLAIEELGKIPDKNYLIVSYESLIVKQEKTLLSIFEFLDLDPKYKDFVRDLSKNNLNGTEPDASSPSLSKWEQQLTPGEVATIDMVIQKNRASYDHIMASARKSVP